MSNKITELKKEDITNILGDISEALKDIEVKYGISIERKGNISFTEANFQLKLDVNVVGNDGIKIQDEKDFLHFCKVKGLNPIGFNKEFKHNNEIFTISGANPRAYKMPIQAVRKSNGLNYKFAIEVYEKNFPNK